MGNDEKMAKSIEVTFKQFRIEARQIPYVTALYRAHNHHLAMTTKILY